MKVIEFLEKANSTLFSYEIIPPNRGGSIDNIFNLVEQLMPFEPPFIDLTSRSAEVYYVSTFRDSAVFAEKDQGL